MFEIFAAIISFCICYGILFVLLPWLRECCLDRPNNRSSHLQPTPSGGGVVFVIIAIFVSVLNLLGNWSDDYILTHINFVCFFAFPLAVVGFLDDRRGLPVGWRYLVQLIVSFVVVFASPFAHADLNFPLLSALLVVTVTAVVNFTNFMDGLDGLVAGCMAVAISAAAIRLSAPWPIWSLVGALVGFLFWNWSPAKVFMGDVGSTFLGSVFAALVFQASSWVEALALLFIATPVFGDACLCVTRRLFAGQPVFQAHRLHLFQRLHQAGWSHDRVSSLYIIATIVLATAFFCGGLQWVTTFAALELLFGFWLDQHVAVPFSEASSN